MGIPQIAQATPPPPLDGHIELFWYWRGHTLPRSTERVLPTGTIELVIPLRADEPQTGGVSGPHSRAFLIERTVEDELLGVHFRPGGAFPFLGTPAGDLQNRYVTLDDLWGRTRAQALLGEIHEAADAHAKFSVLARWLARVARNRLERDAAVSYALARLERDSARGAAGALAAAVNMSQRRFIETFRCRVGLTPKLYSRIQRFQRILDRVASAERVDWVRTALACGYYDQSHFIHDFRSFTGLRPTEYWDLRIAGQANHVRVAD